MGHKGQLLKAEQACAALEAMGLKYIKNTVHARIYEHPDNPTSRVQILHKGCSNENVVARSVHQINRLEIPGLNITTHGFIELARQKNPVWTPGE